MGKKISLVFLLLVIIGLPLVYYASSLQTRLNSRAYTSSQTPTDVYFTQPAISGAQVNGTVIGGVIPTNNKFLIRGANIPSTFGTVPVTWNVAQYTGFNPDVTCPSCYQRGSDNNPGISVAQIKDTTGGVYISTDGPHQRGLLPITPAYWWSSDKYPAPWTVPGGEISFSFNLKIPYAAEGSGGVVYMTSYLLFLDVSSGRSFWYGTQMFDFRGFSDWIGYDGGTNAPIVSGSLGQNSVYMHAGPNSGSFQQSTWTDFRYYETRINEAEFTRAVAAVRVFNPQVCPFCKNFSTNIQNYRITNLNLNPEVYDQPNNSWGKIGMAFQNITLARYAIPPVPTPIPANAVSTVYIRAANATSNKAMQIFFQTATSSLFSEDKSVWVNFPNGGGYTEIVANMSANPNWKGTITGIRIDPFNATGPFGIDYVYLGDANHNYYQKWDFNGATSVTNPFFGWTLSGITNTWTDGNLWGGTGTGDPFFYTTVNIPIGTGTPTPTVTATTTPTPIPTPTPTQALTPTPTPPTNDSYLPYGYLDSISCSVANGWVWDQDTRNVSLTTQVLVDGKLLSTGLANIYRGDVAAVVSHDNGLHGFSIPLPASINDGLTHTFRVYGVDSTTGATKELGLSGKVMTCGGSADKPTYGYVDRATCTSLDGWVWDPDAPNTSLTVNMVVNGVQMASGIANLYRWDVAVLVSHDNGLHGFSIPTPTGIKNNTAQTVHFYAVDTDPWAPTREINLSPKTITCSP